MRKKQKAQLRFNYGKKQNEKESRENVKACVSECIFQTILRQKIG